MFYRPEYSATHGRRHVGGQRRPAGDISGRRVAILAASKALTCTESSRAFGLFQVYRRYFFVSQTKVIGCAKQTWVP